MKMTSDKKWLIVRDEITVGDNDAGYWFAHTRGKIAVSEDGKSATIEMGGDKLYFAILGEGSFTVMPAKHLFEGHNQEGQRDNSDVTKLAIAFKGSSNIYVVITPLTGDPADMILPEDKPLEKW